jgi:hypothetical protein
VPLGVSREQESLSKHDEVYCFGTLLGVLDEPLRRRPVAKNSLGSLPVLDLQGDGFGESLSSYFPIHSRRIYGILWSLCGLSDSKAKAFSYNKRTMDRAMGPFSPLLALPRINNLRAVNIVIRSTPAASTMSFSINYLQTRRFFKKLHSQS